MDCACKYPFPYSDPRREGLCVKCGRRIDPEAEKRLAENGGKAEPSPTTNFQS